MSNQPSRGQRVGTAEGEIDLRNLVALLVDNSWLIIGTIVFALILGAGYAYLATPIYKADALLQIEKKQGGMPGFEELSEIFSEESSSEAEIQIILSRLVLGQVVDQFNMTTKLYPEKILLGAFGKPETSEEASRAPLFSGYSDENILVKVKSFTIPDKWTGQEFQLVSTKDGLAELYHDGSLIAQGSVDEPLVSKDGLTRLILEKWQPSGKVEQNLKLVRVSRLSAINDLRSRLNVTEQVKETGIVTLGLTGANPARIKKVLDAIADTYQTQNIQRNAAEAENSLSFLDKQLPEIKDKLTQAEEKLNDYRLKSESVDLSLETQSVLERLVAIEAKLNELKIKESEISARFTKSHPAYRTLMQQRQSLTEEKKQIEAQIKNLPETQQEVLRMMRDVEVNQQIYVGLLNKVQELRIMKAGTVGNVRIIDEALVQAEPVKPKTGLLLALSALLGLIGSISYVLLRAALNRSIQSPDQLEEQGVPVYAAIPLSEHQQKLDRLVALMRRRKKTRSDSVPLLALNDPGDLAVEALRSLRTSLHFAMMEAENKILMISGPSPEVGKSFISANLAVVLAQVGQRVLVVDADMRKGHLHRYFDKENRAGLSDYLSAQATKEDIIYPTEVDNLHFISRGQVPPNPAELLMHPRFNELMLGLSEEYDLVLVDTPPILAVTDAAIVGQLAGTSLIVARYGQNSVKEVDVTIGRFEQNKVEVKGAILNCIERRASNEYGYYAYKYSSNEA